MTTIAWDGVTLAADTRCTFDRGFREMPDGKITKIGDFVTAITGDLDDLPKFNGWVSSGMDLDNKPDMSDDFLGILIDTNGNASICGGNLLLHKVGAPFADGSGRMYAIAAMELSQDAIGAVNVASKFDTQTGLPITYVRFDRLSDGTIFRSDVLRVSE